MKKYIAAGALALALAGGSLVAASAASANEAITQEKASSVSTSSVPSPSTPTSLDTTSPAQTDSRDTPPKVSPATATEKSDPTPTEPTASPSPASPVVSSPPTAPPTPTTKPTPPSQPIGDVTSAKKKVEVTWSMPNGGTPDHVTWPQSRHSGAYACGVWYQLDTYYAKDAPKLGDTLDQGEDSSVVLSWRFEYGGDCVVIPPQPSDTVVVTTSEGQPNCGKGLVEITTTTTTTPYVYDKESNTWIAGTAVVTSDVTNRPVTEQECPIIVPPTEPTPPTNPPVVTPPLHPAPTPGRVNTPGSPTVSHTVSKPKPVVIATPTPLRTGTAQASSLAYTGSDTLLTWSIFAGGAALLIGGIAAVAFRALRRANTVVDRSKDL